VDEATCPHCGEVWKKPVPDALGRLKCPACGKRFKPDADPVEADQANGEGSPSHVPLGALTIAVALVTDRMLRVRRVLRAVQNQAPGGEGKTPAPAAPAVAPLAQK
jgi:hypothetical protein